MKVRFNDELLFELSDTQKKVIKNDIQADIFESDIKRRLEYSVMHKYEQDYVNMKKDWEPVLSQRYAQLPLSKEAFVDLVVSQQDYKDKFDRDKVAKVVEVAK